jgi:glycosyltransferase involved in cell wall biosynthesis
MNILHISPSYKPAFIYGGTTVSISKLCESLVEIGHTVTVLSTTANGQTELPEQSKIPVDVSGVKVYYFRRLTKDHTHFSPALLYFLWNHVKNYEVIHIHSWWNLVAVFAVLVCWLRGIKPILAPRGMLSAYSFANENSIKKQLIHHSIGKFLLAKTILHATAEAELLEGQSIIPNWQGFVLPNILPLFAKKLPISPKKDTKKVNFLFLSRIDRKKGIEFMFAALANLPNASYQCTIIGSCEENYLQELQTLAKQLQIEKNIHWAGRIEGDMRFQYYADADIFMLLSHNENFANVVIEALSQGTAVVISDKVGLATYVQANNFGEICNLEITEITEKLTNLMQNTEKLQNIRENSPTQIQKDFDMQTIAKQYIAQYQAIHKF